MPHRSPDINIHEKQLIRNLKKGSYDAFNNIYALYAKRLYVYCLKFTKSEEDAEEIVQDTFLKLWRNKADIRQEETVQSLLFIMAKHMLINAYRAKVNHPIFEEYVEYIQPSSVESTGYHIEYIDFVKIIDAAIQKLPVTQQEVIKMSRFHHLANKEIAQKLSLSEQTVKNQLSVGLKTLQEYLSRFEISLTNKKRY